MRLIPIEPYPRMCQKSLKAMLLSFLVAIGLIACTQLAPPPPQTHTESSTLLVAAAASLQKALEEITPLYEQVGENRRANYNFGSSGALQQQIEQGAPADIFISAARKQMDGLQQKNLLVAGTRQNLLTNRLVLVTPKTTGNKLTDFRQLAKPEIQRISIGEPRSVPAGQYATEVLKNLGVLEQVQSKFVLGSSVKSVLASVETGDADAGIVYMTDAKSSDKVVIAAIADEFLHSSIVYPIAILKSSQAIEASQDYLKFLQSQSIQAVFEKYGFGIAKP
jgi:molybdate transport system substrate-binding protein